MLYVVATPIGNLEDITLRAIRVLKEVRWIACEDTRTTRHLLNHYGIATPTISYHDHNENTRAPELAARLSAGEDGALVSDAGMPLISDPGYRLVQAAIEAGVSVVPIPGASAVLAALTVSGLPADTFRFAGFLPEKQGKRREALEALRHQTETTVFYEAPHRILATLSDIAEILGTRPIVVARELTKLYEEVLRGTAAEIRAQLAERASVRGEITLLIGRAAHAETPELPLEQALEALIQAGVSRMDALKLLAKERGLSKREIYKHLIVDRPKQ
ncbi:MAG TPA: 16S rRNA (cytidine(1402)-2'-O)-methyltransferase [Solibacterales bacterium]|nr:16S rRNA (cytidine(1402)-2'-O)-methyltransferase [Bryobacterales bacterium]